MSLTGVKNHSPKFLKAREIERYSFCYVVSSYQDYDQKREEQNRDKFEHLFCMFFYTGA